MKPTHLIALLLLLSFNVQGQTRFYNSVKIEFEKTVYVRQLYKEVSPRWYEMVKDRVPETSLSYFDFTGDNAKSIYKPGREVQTDPRMRNDFAADKNVVYTDFASGRSTTQKPVFEETFLVEDSLVKIKWKLTPDTRIIAGFECRKAVGIMNDSIGVFAFYTDELMISGGPESVQGLPGMILGMGVPRLHTTWFATKVEVNGVNMNSVIPATKGKKVNYKTMVESLDKVLKNWGAEGKKLLMIYMI
ncbi:MAG TPA: GLPGLI family protein [Chitinophagaceae bacterium]|jgi:GLPGLI family protein|nr:GLPGLI family protein [Chitinophagaceae bacterium]